MSRAFLPGASVVDVGAARHHRSGRDRVTTFEGPGTCPFCRAEFTHATAMQAGDAAPRDGDLGVCLRCAKVVAYTGRGLELRLPTPAEVSYAVRDERLAALIGAVLAEIGAS